MSILTTPLSPSATVLGGYAPMAAGYDELRDANGALREHWRQLASLLEELGGEELALRHHQAARLIRDNGVSYNVYGDPRGDDRPWKLDLLPLVIAPTEWDRVQRGVAQRARLLEAILADVYGERRLLAEGRMPAELLHANPAFLRPAVGAVAPTGRWLTLYAADLVRGVDGVWRVLSDRTQAPAGMGYALENRIILSSVLDGPFRECQVQRLAAFFQSVRQSLQGLAPTHRENPRIVLLTPGAYNESYFEHAYLARYLGYTLVEGGDLTVRDTRVYLKTLSGLQQVDVILRRLDDEWCDPVELRGDSFLGVPGLLHAVRAGSVSVANAIGAGFAQSPGLQPLMPALAERLIGEGLILPSPRTWWLGDGSAGEPLGRLGELVLKPAFPGPGPRAAFPWTMEPAARDELLGRVRAEPWRWVAQEREPASCMPILTPGQAEVGALILRTYAVVRGEQIVVMPGGLCRVASDAPLRGAGLQTARGSKDTWVLSEGPVSPISLMPPSGRIELSRLGGELTSRVADNLFWLGRYMQRVEWLVRLARAAVTRLTDQASGDSLPIVASLCGVLCGRGIAANAEVVETELLGVLFDPGETTSLPRTLGLIHDLSRRVRDRISADMFRILLDVAPDAASAERAAPPLGSVLETLNDLVLRCAAFSGLAMDSMSRGQAWRFLDMGRRLERAAATAALLRGAVAQAHPSEPDMLEAVLEVADATLTYRRRYLTQLAAVAVADLLLADATSPASAAFQLQALAAHLPELPRDLTHPSRSPDIQLCLRATTALRLADLHAACDLVDGRRRAGLARLLEDVAGACGAISDALTHAYFSHAPASRQLSAGEAR